MLIDVLISSAAKPEVLKEVLESVQKKFLGGEHTFRFVLFEFRVGTNHRAQQQQSYTWVRKNRKKFDEIVLVNRKVDNDLWFKDMVDKVKSDYFLYIRGNAPLSSSILLDTIIAIMISNNDEIPQIVFNSGDITKESIVTKENVDGLTFGELNFFSKSAGVFNTKLVSNIIENSGSLNKGDLTQASNKLGYKNYVLADRKKHIDIL